MAESMVAALQVWASLQDVYGLKLTCAADAPDVLATIQKAVVAERERCAKIADGVEEECHRNAGSLYSTAGAARSEEIAQRIREAP